LKGERRKGINLEVILMYAKKIIPWCGIFRGVDVTLR
jgi:hypothetical protein